MLKITDSKLPKETFGQKVNLKLLALANYVQSEKSHIGLRSTKTRGEINKSTKKIYKQKGTGGARHGSRRANLFVGGGIVFGPRPVKKVLNLSKLLKSKAKISAFSSKSKEGKIFVFSGIEDVTKTKDVAKFLKSVEGKKFTFLLAKSSLVKTRFFSNIKNVKVLMYDHANALNILTGGTILIDENALVVNKEKVVKTKVVKTKKS